MNSILESEEVLAVAARQHRCLPITVVRHETTLQQVINGRLCRLISLDRPHLVLLEVLSLDSATIGSHPKHFLAEEADIASAVLRVYTKPVRFTIAPKI